jgi:2,3-bisphosphoglycerate-independent phosphoglycerate mutase
MNLPVAFKSPRVDQSFGEVVAAAGLRQQRIAESEKRPHVGYYFDGAEDAAFDATTQHIVPSPLVDEWHEKPALSAHKIADAAIAALEARDADFILVNFANADVLAHSGDIEATIAGVEAVDAALGRIAEAAQTRDAVMLVTGSHGNAERMLDAGKPHTAHTANPVPFVWVAKDAPQVRSDGSLADVAPTMLDILGLEPPAAMTGRSLRLAKDEG